MTQPITPTAHSSLVGGSTAARRTEMSRDPSPEVVRRFLHYSPSTGRFWYKIRSYDTFSGTPFIKVRNGKAWNQRCAGHRACVTPSGTGHLKGRIMGKNYGAHRLAWIHYHGTPIPDGLFIDHINGDPADNRIANLRLATPQQSVFNTSAQSNSRSGVKGVSWDSVNSKWKVAIKFGKQYKFLGRFKTLEDATRAYNEAAEVHHGDFAHHTSRGSAT